VPAETPDGSKLLEAVLRIRPGARPFASPTCSDWVFLRHLDAVKLGPGDSRRSHTADECGRARRGRPRRRAVPELAREVLR
jgi:acetylornithine deacetylase/succinyl-diaminopimelate desuccinylase-like protein